MADTASSGQTTILRSGQPQAFAGMVADTGIKDDLSAYNLEVSAEIAFGLGVKWSGQRGALLPTASSSVIRGVSVWNGNHQTGLYGDLGTTGLKPNAAMVVRDLGRIWVLVDAGQAVGDFTPGITRGWCRFETDGGSNTVVGAWRGADDGHAIDCTKQCVYVSSVILAADGVSLIAELDCNFIAKP